MATESHLEHLLQGVDAWNEWRQRQPLLEPDLSGAELTGANLGTANLGRTDLAGATLRDANLAGTNLSGANLTRANLSGANLSAVTTALAAAQLGAANLSGADLTAAHFHGANFVRADLSGAKLGGAKLGSAQLAEANLTAADLTEADLTAGNLVQANMATATLVAATLKEANLNRADLAETNLTWANLSGALLVGGALRKANLTGADLSRANLRGANLAGANLSRANLTGALLGRASLDSANLSAALLVETDLASADLTGCRIYGMSAWGLKLSESTRQQNIVVTREDEPEVTADNIEVAQFLHLLLNNTKLVSIIDTISSDVVLILGHFPAESKGVLDVLRDGLRKPGLGYVPIVCNFEGSSHQPSVDTVTKLARMARFVIADMTDARILQQDLPLVAANNPMVPLQPIAAGAQEQGIHDWGHRVPSLLKVYHYKDAAQLAADLDMLILACRLTSWRLHRHGYDKTQFGARRSDIVQGRTT